MDIEEVIERLYGLPLTEFTSERNEAARQLRKAGQRDAAERVKALGKPSVAAGAVNRLVREQRGEVEKFLRAATALRDAQFSGKGDLAAATRREHEALERLTRAGGQAVRQSLLAAAVDDDAARQLLEARLERELEPRGFGTLLAHAAGLRSVTPVERPAPASPAGAPAARTGPRPAPPTRKEADDDAARAKLHDAKAALTAAETQERQARRHWERTLRDLEQARADVDEAQGDLDRLRDL